MTVEVRFIGLSQRVAALQKAGTNKPNFAASRPDGTSAADYDSSSSLAPLQELVNTLERGGTLGFSEERVARANSICAGGHEVDHGIWVEEVANSITSGCLSQLDAVVRSIESRTTREPSSERLRRAERIANDQKTFNAEAWTSMLLNDLVDK
ncbi:MAG: hypothetical protein KC933_16560 [Myxococcales bacterium]|nr:hypothetical protein [Myxococcales bacterium]